MAHPKDQGLRVLPQWVIFLCPTLSRVIQLLEHELVRDPYSEQEGALASRSGCGGVVNSGLWYLEQPFFYQGTSLQGCHAKVSTHYRHILKLGEVH